MGIGVLRYGLGLNKLVALKTLFRQHTVSGAYAIKKSHKGNNHRI